MSVPIVLVYEPAGDGRWQLWGSMPAVVGMRTRERQTIELVGRAKIQVSQGPGKDSKWFNGRGDVAVSLVEALRHGFVRPAEPPLGFVTVGSKDGSETMKPCVFCQIVAGSLPTKLLTVEKLSYCVAFRDLRPATPIHVVVAPRLHVERGDEGLADTLGHTMHEALRVATHLGLDKGGFRLVTNLGPDAGQQVPHLHVHVLGGGALGSIA